MRVLHVLGELRPSGGEVVRRDAVDACHAHGVERLVLATSDKVERVAEEHHRPSAGTLHLPFSRDSRFSMRFVRLIRSAQVAVFHAHAERAKAALGILARASGVRVVRTAHCVLF